MALTTINSGGVKDDSIVNADIKSDAAIAGSKLVAATTSVPGSMSAADKTKLDGVATSATANPSAPALTGSTNNTICTVTGANAIQGEANLTFDGTTLNVGTGSGSTASAGYDEFVIQGGDADIGMNFLSPAANDKKQQISFGDSNNNQSGRIVYDHDDDHLTIGTNGTAERLRIDSSGKVGIGITPTARLHVNGISSEHIITARSADSNGNCVVNILSEGTTGTSRILFSDTAANDGIISYSHNDRALIFGAAGTSENMRIDSSGRLGIGTDSPTRYLHVKETAGGNAQIIVETTANAERAQIEFKSPHGTWVTGTYGGNTTGDWLTYTAGAKNAVFHQNGSEKLRIQSGGGISFNGDTAADNALDDFEEGQWTPVCQYESGGGSISNTGTGLYTKVGNRVFFHLFVNDLDYTSAGTNWPAVSLPFAVANTTGNFSAVTFAFWSCFGSNPFGYCRKGNSHFVIGAISSGNNSNTANTWTGTNKAFMASGHYVTA